MRRRKSGVIFVLAAMTVLVFLAGTLFLNEKKDQKVYQDIVSLEGMVYDSALLKEAAKIPGIQSFSPVLELNVRLKIEGYTMDAVLLGVDLEELVFKGKALREVTVGSCPVLLLGEKSLAGLADINGHGISEDQQKKYLENYENLDVQYLISAAGKGERWQPCVVAGVLSSPSEFIFVPSTQAQNLLSENGLDRTVRKCLLTIKGEQNQERALGYFGG